MTLTAQRMIAAPGPARSFFGTTLYALRRDPLGFLAGLAREYGDVAQVHIGPQRVFLLNRPDLVRDMLVTNSRLFVKGRGLERARRLLGNGLLTSEGDTHLRQRRLAQPAFHRQRLLGYARTMVSHSERMAGKWRAGETRDVALDMNELTLGIVAETLFGADVANETADVRDALTTLVEMFDLMLLPFSELLEHLPLPATIRFRRARTRLDGTVRRMIDARRRDPGEHSDLLSMLVEARDDDGSEMTDELLRDEVLTLFLAGHETTANALTWTWYLLSRNPDADRRMSAEIEEVTGGRPVTAEDFPRLVHTQRVFMESLRLFPPAWAIGRRAVADYEADGYFIPSGSIVIASQYLLHRDERYFTDPERFDPDRWTEEGRAQRPKFSYFPFGAGPRQCIGEHFAWMEGTLLLASIARRWRLRHEPGHRVEPQPLITLRPRFGMRLGIESRNPFAP